jgi:hypothetical protein
MAKKAKKLWLASSPKQSKPTVPDTDKQLIEQKCNELIETEFKPKYIESPPTDHDLNYRTDIFGKWYRNYFYFCSTYNCPSPRAISPSFESRSARLEYVGPDCFNVAYMRHTGQWWEILHGVSLEKCLSEIRNNPLLHP